MWRLGVTLLVDRGKIMKDVSREYFRFLKRIDYFLGENVEPWYGWDRASQHFWWEIHKRLQHHIYNEFERSFCIFKELVFVFPVKGRIRGAAATPSNVQVVLAVRTCYPPPEFQVFLRRQNSWLIVCNLLFHSYLVCFVFVIAFVYCCVVYEVGT